MKASSVSAMVLLSLLSGCTSAGPPPEPTSSPATTPLATSPLAAIRLQILQNQSKAAEQAATDYLASHPQDEAGELLLEDAHLAGQGPVALYACMVEPGPLGDAMLRGARIAQQDVNAHGLLPGAHMLVLPAGPGEAATLPASVLGAVTDGICVQEAVSAGVPQISLAPPQVGGGPLSLTPSPLQQWRGETAYLYRKVKGTLLVAIGPGRLLPANIPWARDNFQVEARTAGRVHDLQRYAAVVIAAPMRSVNDVVALLSTGPHAPLWICDLLGEQTTADASPSSPAPMSTAPPLPDGVLTASEFAVDAQGIPAQQAFAADYLKVYPAHPPNVSSWRAFHGLETLVRATASPTSSRADVRNALQHVVPEPEPPCWYILETKNGTWTVKERFVIPVAKS